MNVNEPCACQQSAKALRYRVNVSVSVKGIHTWEATVDGTNYKQAEILALSDTLAAELENRYGQREIF